MAHPAWRGLRLRDIGCFVIGIAISIGVMPVAALAADSDWSQANGPVDGTRYSPLTQINTDNVGQLQVAWTFSPKGVPTGTESYPVIVDDRAYVTTTGGAVFALNAATGALLWHFDPPLHGGGPNRGVATGEGKVYVLTTRCRLYALDQLSGRVAYQVPVCDPSAGYSESTAPLYADGMLYLGSSGGDNGTRGFEEARDAATGKLLWQFYTVPERGGDGSWLSAAGLHGGGDVWFVPTLAQSLGLLYISTGNPSPDYYGVDRPGANPWTDSVIALDAKTGHMVWAYQEVPHDLWDYDAASPPTVFATGAGPAVGEAGKDGFWYEWDAKTGQMITLPEPFVKQDHRAPPVTGDPVLNWPGAAGGSQWSPVPYDPQTGYTYVEGVEMPEREKAEPVNPHGRGKADFGTTFVVPPGFKPYGTFTAFDVNSGTAAWQITEPTPMVGGSTVTASGLIFVGVSGNGTFEALSAKTGARLWSAETGKRIDSAASVYSVDGREFVLIATGGSHVYYGGFGASAPEFIAYALPPAYGR